MSYDTNTSGVYLKLPFKNDTEAYTYFKQYFPVEFSVVESTNYHLDYELNISEILNEVIYEQLTDEVWKPFCDIKGNWCWISYFNSNVTQTTYLENLINTLTLKLITQHNISNEFINLQGHIQYFNINWHTGSDFPLIIK